MKHPHYFKPVAGLQYIDVYRTLQLFAVTDPCLQHAIKKLLVAGGRGAKDISQDVQEAIDTLERWNAMRKEDRRAEAMRGAFARIAGYPAVEVGVDVRFDQTGRQEAVEQNGNDGALYREPGYASGQIPSAQDKEPERPRHLCQTCAQGHATHECTAGQEPIPLAELAIQQGGKPLEMKDLADALEPKIEIGLRPARPAPELPPTDHLVDPTGKPRWEDAPHWACYLTQDENGVWKWWHKKPAVMGSRWQGVGMFAEVNSGEVVGRWQDQFECAPGLTVGAEA